MLSKVVMRSPTRQLTFCITSLRGSQFKEQCCVNPRLEPVATINRAAAEGATLMETARRERTQVEPTAATHSQSVASAPAITASLRGTWFSHPYICVPADTKEGPTTVLVDVAKWQSALAASGGNVNAASSAIVIAARTRGHWKYHEGEPAILLQR